MTIGRAAAHSARSTLHASGKRDSQILGLVRCATVAPRERKERVIRRTATPSVDFVPLRERAKDNVESSSTQRSSWRDVMIGNQGDEGMTDIRLADFSDARIVALLTRHLEGMHHNSPAGHVFALDWSELQRPEIRLYALWAGEDLLGVGALRELDSRTGEIKSMRTADAHLRRGVGAAILDHIIAEARKRGYARLALETGSGPVFEPALTLYRKRGFINGATFGNYQVSSFNQFLHLDLVPTD